MRTLCLTTVLCIRAVVPASAADLATIDRSIASEPDYTSQSPRYCLLVFGPHAKTHVWLVRDDRAVYVDRNSDGDLTDPRERIEFANDRSTSIDLGEIVERGRGVKHTKLVVSWNSENTARIRITLHGERRQYVGRDRAKKLHFSENPRKAPIVHFGGPLTLARFSSPVTLQRGLSRSRLRLMVGTPGLGEGTFAGLHYGCTVDHGPLVADVEYPNRQLDAPPIKTTLALKTKS